MSEKTIVIYSSVDSIERGGNIWRDVFILPYEMIQGLAISLFVDPSFCL